MYDLPCFSRPLVFLLALHFKKKPPSEIQQYIALLNHHQNTGLKQFHDHGEGEIEGSLVKSALLTGLEVRSQHLPWAVPKCLEPMAPGTLRLLLVSPEPHPHSSVYPHPETHTDTCALMHSRHLKKTFL